MCGIAGILNSDHHHTPDLRDLENMLTPIRHRGPDDIGIHIQQNVGFGFRRLSIIDVHNGHQPMSNEDGSVWIVFNGEIYNFKELRRDLITKGHVFKTNTDTETIVHLYEDLGTKCVAKLRGMFASYGIPNPERYSVLAIALELNHSSIIRITNNSYSDLKSRVSSRL
ncbi:MAG: hypothetical protein IPL46_27365 [Saprospiraceae bacterium]|nr:hypothetical protein [Saprospiraceae bacterium]